MQDKSWLKDLLIFIFSVVFIVIPIRFFVIQPFLVSGSSMEETFNNSDYLIVDRISYRINEPERGDVIVFKYPKDPSKFFIKRIIGLPNEKIVIEGEKIYIEQSDGENMLLEEDYITYSSFNDAEFSIGENEYFVMGDNRAQSVDSRVFGLLERDLIIGKVFLRLFPLNEISVWPGNTNYQEN
jgi:signal peptidase I